MARDLTSVLLLGLLVFAWSGGSVLAAFAQPVHHLVATSAPTAPVGPDAALSEDQLASAAAQAKADWQAVRPSAALSVLSFSVADLGGLQLGAESGDAITVDVDAAGWGWSQMSLVTVVRHEIGHALGVDHSDSGLMADALAPGASFGVTHEYAEAVPVESTQAATTPDTTQADSTPDTTPDTTQADTTPDTAQVDPAQADTPPTGGADDAGTVAGATGGDAGTTAGDSTTGTTSGSSTTGSTVTSPKTGSTRSSDTATALAAGSTTTTSPSATAGDDTITIVAVGGGGYEVRIGATVLGTVSGTGTLDVDGLGGRDTLVAPDLAGVWKVTKINGGSYQIQGGPTFSFSHIENLTGAATAAEEYRFSPNAGITGTIDDGTGRLTVQLAGFVEISGTFDFTQATQGVKAATTTNTAGTTIANANILKAGASACGDCTVFVGLKGLGSQVGITGTLSDFAFAVVTSTDAANEADNQAWHVFDGTMTAPRFVAPDDVDLDLHLADGAQVTIAANTASANKSWLNLAGDPITFTTTARSLGFTGSQLSATAPVSIDLGGFLHVAGNLTFTKGGISSVDVDTGLVGVPAGDLPAELRSASLAVSDTDPTDGSLARSSDYGKVWNLQVSALQFAFTGASFFVGNNFGWTDGDGDNVIDKPEIASGAFGLFGGGVNLAFLLLTPLGGMPISKRFTGLTGEVDDIGLIGFEDFLTIDVEHLDFAANLGPTLVTGATAATVDWISSFPDPNTGDDTSGTGGTDPTPAGYHVFVGGTDPPVLYVDSVGPAFKVSATRAVISISDFVFIGGSFSLEKGAVRYVDVKTENLSTTTRTNLKNSITDIKAADPGGTTLARNADASLIWNLPVDTLTMGIGNGSIFVGYNPGGFPPDIALPLQSSGLGGGALGLLATGISLGFVIATPRNTGLKLPSFFALRAEIASLTPIGMPDEVELYLKNIHLEVNRGGQIGTDRPSLAYVDWAASFPDENADDDGEATDPTVAGLVIPTGGTDTVAIDYDAPIVGVKADQVVLSISEFVHISGGFSFELGGREKVDVNTGGITRAQGGAIAGAVGNVVTSTDGSDPTDGELATNADGSVIYNLPVRTILVGISHASFFVGYTRTPPAAAARRSTSAAAPTPTSSMPGTSTTEPSACTPPTSTRPSCSPHRTRSSCRPGPSRRSTRSRPSSRCTPPWPRCSRSASPRTSSR